MHNSVFIQLVCFNLVRALPQLRKYLVFVVQCSRCPQADDPVYSHLVELLTERLPDLESPDYAMFIRSNYFSLVILMSGAVLASDADPRLDYDLFAAVTPIGNSAIELRPAKDEILLLQFWASWCQSCGSIMWDLDKLVSQNPGMKYIGVSLDDKIADAKNYIRKHRLFEKYSDRYYIDVDKRFSISLGVESVPSILLVDGNGKILVKKSGHLNSADLQEFVSAFHSMP